MIKEHDEYKLIIGCGNQKDEGWISIDKADYGHNIVRDLRRGLPFCDDSVSEIRAESVLEHICDNDDYIFVMNECLRVLKNEGTMYILVPHWRGRSAYKDPTHCRFFDEKTFCYLEKENDWHYGFDKRWKIESMKNNGDITLEVILRAEK